MIMGVSERLEKYGYQISAFTTANNEPKERYTHDCVRAFSAWRLKGKINVLYEILELRSSENLYPNPGKGRKQRDPALSYSTPIVCAISEKIKIAEERIKSKAVFRNRTSVLT